jgi:hypothetical protein
MTYTKEQIAQAALEAGIPAGKVKEMLRGLPVTPRYRMVPVHDPDGRVVGQQYALPREP